MLVDESETSGPSEKSNSKKVNRCIYVYVYMYKYLYENMDIYIYVCIRVYMYICMYIYVQKSMLVKESEISGPFEKSNSKKVYM
jgi:hypothetical protein